MATAFDRQTNFIQPVGVTIASGQTTSGTADLFGCTTLGLLVPAGMTGSSLSFLVSVDGTNFYPLTDGNTGNLITILISNSAAAFPLLAPYFAAWRYMQIVSNATETGSRDLLLSPYEV